MIKAIIFDMGGVLVDLDTDICIKNFKVLAGFDAVEMYIDRFHQKGFISKFEQGLTNTDEFCEECLKHCRPGTPADVIKHCFRSLLIGLNKDALALIKELSPQYDLYILSNNNPIARAKFEELLTENGIPGPQTFKKEFYSYEMKMLKPSMEIYQEAVKQIGLPLEEILFVDDSKSNSEGAMKAGITTLWLRPGMDIASEVKSFL